MMKLIKSSNYKSMPWKNGEGVTNEIEIYPPNSDFANNDFDFRVSSALVRAPSAFSKFPGFDRILAVWQGDGLLINNVQYEPLQPFSFAGEKEIFSNPAGEVADLGIIYNREKFVAYMDLETFAADTTDTLQFGEGWFYLFCCKGSVTIDDQSVEAGDTFKVTGPRDIQLRALSATKLMIISVNRRNFE